MALRVLIAVNYSAGENVAGDSGRLFTTKLVHALVKSDPDLHFYVLIPEKHAEGWTAPLCHPQVTLIPIRLEPRLHGGDFQFDPADLYGRFDFRRYDIDLLFLNQLETVPAFLQFINRQTFHNVPALSYVHWFDTRRPSTPKHHHHRPALLAALSGMAVSTAVGCNSAYGKDQILKQSTLWFNEEVVARLQERIMVLPSGVDTSEIMEHAAIRLHDSKRLLVNHRLLKYTGVRNLLTETLPSLWGQGRDFSVLATNPTRVRLPGTITNAPWLTVQTLPRDAYIRALWRSDVVIAPHRAAHWSISTLEAICAECVPLMNVESFFREMMAPLLAALPRSVREHVNNRWFFFRGNIVRRLSALLDNIEEEHHVARLVGRRAREMYDWSYWTDRWLELFYRAEREIPAVAERNPSMRRILDLLGDRGILSKQEILRYLGWAPKQRALAWTSFRKGLKRVAPDDSGSAEVVFRMVDKQPLSAPSGHGRAGDLSHLEEDGASAIS